MTTLKLTRIGNSVGVVLPREVLARLKLEVGDTLVLTDLSDGVLLTTAQCAGVAVQIAAGRRIAKKYRNVLRELAK